MRADALDGDLVPQRIGSHHHAIGRRLQVILPPQRQGKPFQRRLRMLEILGIPAEFMGGARQQRHCGDGDVGTSPNSSGTSAASA